MKVTAFNGSARKDGNTANLINRVLEEIKSEGIETEIVNLAGKKINGCIACMKCFENQDRQCSRKNDDVNEIIDMMAASDGIILGSPTYFSNVSTEIKAVIDRAGLVAIANDHMFKRIDTFVQDIPGHTRKYHYINTLERCLNFSSCSSKKKHFQSFAF